MIVVDGVSKTYRSLVRRRAVRALDGLSLTIDQGEVLGIAGPNGAGKTTLLALILGYRTPTTGVVRIDGRHPRRYVESRGIAYVPELLDIPTWWTLGGALERYALLSGVRRALIPTRVDDVIATLGVTEHRRKRIKQLSKGNLQRLGIAQALLSDAHVVILDEPTHGLDPVWTQRFRSIVQELRRPDRAVVIASHNLDELERVADRVAILDKGRLTGIADGSEHHGTVTEYRLVLAREFPGLIDIFPEAARMESAREVGYLVRGTLEEINGRVQRLLAEGGTIRALYPARSRLEAAFREAVGEP